MAKDKIKLQRFFVLLASFAVVIVLLLLETSIYVVSRKNYALKTGSMLASQIENILESNAGKEKVLIESLKEDFTTRAKSVAYIIDKFPSAEYDLEELKHIALLCSIDEIHLFTTEGFIYSGTVPEYYDFRFDSGEHFKPMLNDKTLSMCQDITPNTAEQKQMMYAICWNEGGTRMVQVGIEPVRLISESYFSRYERASPMCSVNTSALSTSPPTRRTIF